MTWLSKPKVPRFRFHWNGLQEQGIKGLIDKANEHEKHMKDKEETTAEKYVRLNKRVTKELVSKVILGPSLQQGVPVDRLQLKPGDTLAVSTNPKAAHGALKAPLGFSPKLAILEMEGVMAGGAYKYDAYNFRESAIDAMTYIGAINRHFALWEDGEDLDDESHRPHLAHIMACCALLLDSSASGKLVDNRSKTGLIKGTLEQIAADYKLSCDAWDYKCKNIEDTSTEDV